MVSFNLVSAGVAGLVAFSLQGCGDGGVTDGDGGGTVQPSAAPVTVVTTTTVKTTTPDACNGAVVVPPGSNTDEGRLVDALNQLYTGYDANDANSPSGVTLRMGDDFSFFCGTPCHETWPDCRISASLYNSKIMMMHDTFKPAVTMNRDAGVIFNQTAVEASLGKCVFMYDGATFGRVNRGCGCAARQHTCGPEGAYWNQECEYGDLANHGQRVDSTCHNNTETSPDVDSCWCKTENRNPSTPTPEDTLTTDLQCFFRGPGLYPPHPLESEFHEMVGARIAHQESNGGTEVLPGTTPPETRYKQEYWNEVIVDAEVLGNMLRDPDVETTSAVSAFIYVEGLGGKPKAIAMQLQALRDYGYPVVPIVSFDPNVDVRCSGPFREATDVPTPELCVAAYAQCGDNICCQDGLECVVDNPNYSSCKPSQTQLVA